MEVKYKKKGKNKKKKEKLYKSKLDFTQINSISVCLYLKCKALNANGIFCLVDTMDRGLMNFFEQIFNCISFALFLSLKIK